MLNCFETLGDEFRLFASPPMRIDGYHVFAVGACTFRSFINNSPSVVCQSVAIMRECNNVPAR
jgi:hypothetical protein